MKINDIQPKKKLKESSPSQFPISDDLRKLEQIFRNNGHDLRFVGGAVRDFLLGKTPKDIDLATTATPEEMIDLMIENDIRYIPTGLQHGTITAVLDEPYEITTLRIDTETDGRHARVEFTRDWEVDAERRDLTFNALSMDFNGKIYDYFGGVEDLKNYTAKFVGDASRRIQEDYLRILRYFRFIGKQPKIKWDENTLEAIQNNKQGLASISGERIWMEMEKILAGDNAWKVIRKMHEFKLPIGLDLSRWETLRNVSSNTQNPVVRLLALLENESDLVKIRKHWKLSNEVYEFLKFGLDHRWKSFNKKNVSEMLVRNPRVRSLLSLLMDFNGNEGLKKFIESWEIPKFPVNGYDLEDMGIKPGKEMGSILNRLKTLWINSDYTLTKDELISKI